MNFETTQHNPSAVAHEDIPSKWYMINGEMFETKYVCYPDDTVTQLFIVRTSCRPGLPNEASQGFIMAHIQLVPAPLLLLGPESRCPQICEAAEPTDDHIEFQRD